MRKLAMSFKYAFMGIRYLIFSQPNARIHLAATVIVILAGFYFEVSRTEWCILVLTITIVWVAEGMNTAIEWLCDRVSRDHDEIIAKVKDTAAGAVLLSAVAAIVVAVLIFLPHLRAL